MRRPAAPPALSIAMNITLKQLRVFCALYELRSFTAAARAAFVTQSAVSKLCAELEAELGQPLFERSTRSVEPCEGAADFYMHAQQILGSVRQAERSMAGLRTLERGTVGVACSPMMMYGLLGDLLADFHRAHPGIKLNLYELSTDETLTYVRQSKVDFGIVSMDVPDQELATRLIYRDRLFAICSREHPLAQRQSISWGRLAAQDHIGLHRNYNVRRSFDRVIAELGLKAEFRLEAGMLTSVLNFVAAGLGVTVLPGYACGFARQLGLHILKIDGARHHHHELWLVQRAHSRLTLAVNALLDDMGRYLAEREREAG